MGELKTAYLVIIPVREKLCYYRLIDEAGKIVWRNRPYPTPEGHAGARERMADWALANGYQVGEAEPAPQRKTASRYGRH